MINEVLSETRTAMEKAVKSLKKDMTKVRTGRASISLLDDVKVDYYGVLTPLSQVATLAVPEARLMTVQPWEKNLIPDIEKAIFKADLGMTPSSEETKISVRNSRRDANETLKMLEKEKEITEDDLKRSEKEVQQLTDEFVTAIDSIVQNKEQEVMEV